MTAEGATSRGPTAIRPATLDDVDEIRSILTEHGDDGPHPVVDVVGPYVRHLIATGRVLVADEGERLAAFGASVATGTGRHLSDLFVRSDRLGQGIGRPLLDAVFADDWPRTTFASADPRALPLYIRAGMSPLWLGLYLMGSGTRVPAPDPRITAESADASRMTSLELEWTGADRRADHRHWASQPDADSFVVLDGGDAVAIGCVERPGVARCRHAFPARTWRSGHYSRQASGSSIATRSWQAARTSSIRTACFRTRGCCKPAGGRAPDSRLSVRVFLRTHFLGASPRSFGTHSPV